MIPEAALLAKLAPGVEVAAGKVRGLGAVVPALVEAGLLASRRDGRVVLVSLTPAGEAERARRLAALPPAKAPRVRAAPLPATPKAAAARAAPKATPAVRLAALEAAVAALVARVAALEGAPAATAPAVADDPAAASQAAVAAPAPAAVADDPAALRATIIAIVGDLDAGHRLGGLVPIPDVRSELRRRGVAAADADVTAALEELERSWVFDLSIAQAPNAVRDRAAGIERAGRGLLYYVARR